MKKSGKTRKQKETPPQTYQTNKEKNLSQSNSQVRRSFPSLCRDRSATSVSANQLHKATPYFVSKSAKKKT